jgi:hypothetical protein
LQAPPACHAACALRDLLRLGESRRSFLPCALSFAGNAQHGDGIRHAQSNVNRTLKIKLEQISNLWRLFCANLLAGQKVMGHENLQTLDAMMKHRRISIIGACEPTESGICTVRWNSLERLGNVAAVTLFPHDPLTLPVGTLTLPPLPKGEREND